MQLDETAHTEFIICNHTIKGHKMIAWMGLCAVSVYMEFLRNAGEGESKTSRTPNLPGVETQREK
jgi:hypothetical protein